MAGRAPAPRSRSHPGRRARFAVVAARFNEPIVKKLVTAARASADWYERFGEHMKLGLMDFAYGYITRSGRIDDARLRALSPRFMARYEASLKETRHGT